MPTTNTDMINKYMNVDLLKELGIDALAPEEAVAFFSSFGSIVWQRIILRLNDELTDDQKQKLEAMLETKPENADAIRSFFANEVAGFETMVDEEVTGYKKELLDRMETVNAATA